MKKRFLSVALAAAVAMSATACTSNPAESKTTAAPAETKAEETTAAEASSEGEKKEAAADGDLITVGYAQVGAESDWRTANTESFKSTFTEENGYKLIFDDAQQKQENQIKAIRSFIQQDVDYIVVAPVVETGWETVLEEAKEAGIPVRLLRETGQSRRRDQYGNHSGNHRCICTGWPYRRYGEQVKRTFQLEYVRQAVR